MCRFGSDLISFLFVVQVPKLYRWLSERYPKINQVVKTALKPEFGMFVATMVR